MKGFYERIEKFAGTEEVPEERLNSMRVIAEASARSLARDWGGWSPPVAVKEEE